MNTFAITIVSAVSTLEVLDRQARKDCGKVASFVYSVYQVLDSAEAKRKYRIAREVFGRVAEIVSLIAIALCNDLDRWIRSHEVAEAIEPTAPAPIEIVEVEPEVQPETETSAIETEEVEPVTIESGVNEMSDIELIKAAKAKKVPMARKMSLTRKLSVNARMQLLEAIGC